MALSSMTNLTQAQIPLSCQFCETSLDINWKCLDCALLLCEPCKQRLHSKVKSAKLHHIVVIGNLEVIQNIYGSQTAAQNTCQQHTQQICCLFCKSCEKPICPICLLGVHKEHQWKELWNKSVDNKAIPDDADSPPPPLPPKLTPGRHGKGFPPVPSSSRSLSPRQVQQALPDDDDSPPIPIPSKPTPVRHGKGLPPVPSPSKPLPPRQVQKALPDDDDSPPIPIPSKPTPVRHGKELPPVPSPSKPLPPRQLQKALPDDDDSPPPPIPSKPTPVRHGKELPLVPSPSKPLPPRQLQKSDDYMSRYIWYFGEISRTVGTKILLEFNQNGAYLLRKSTKGGDKQPYTLMVLYTNYVYNFKVRERDDGRVALGEDKSNEMSFKSVADLIKHYKNDDVLQVHRDRKQENRTMRLKCPPT